MLVNAGEKHQHVITQTLLGVVAAMTQPLTLGGSADPLIPRLLRHCDQCLYNCLSVCMSVRLHI